jgi:hypothetical protein
LTKIPRYQDTPSIINESAFAKAGKAYSEMTGVEKRDYLFDHGVRPTAYDNYQGEGMPDAVLGLQNFSRAAFRAIRRESLAKTLTFGSDEFAEAKQKVIHTYGSTAKVVFTPNSDTPYSGLFSETCHGLARFSYAGPVIAIGVVPALAVKFPIDGDRLSQNLVLLNKLDRQQPFWHFFSKHTYNSVFQNSFSNILPMPRVTNLIARTMNSRFQTVVEEGTVLMQPLDGLAAITTRGAPVEPGKRSAPYRIIFVPTSAAVAASDRKIEFRDDLSRNVKAGTTIYDVLALEEDQETQLRKRGIRKLAGLQEHAKQIGTLTTESEFIASKYGDYRLFFKHSDRFVLEEFKDPAQRQS